MKKKNTRPIRPKQQKPQRKPQQPRPTFLKQYGKSTERICRRSIESLINKLFKDALHHQQLRSLRQLVLGVIFSNMLGIAAVGTAMARRLGKSPKHGIKQLDRFLSSLKVGSEIYLAKYVQVLLGQQTEILVALDWTEFDGDDHSMLCACLIWRGRRTPPFVWMTVKKSTLKGKQKKYEQQLLKRLRELVPEKVRVIIVADRGFGDVKFFAFLKSLNFQFVIRFRQCIYVGFKKRWLIPAAMLVPRNGQVRVIRDEVLTAQEKGPYTVVLKKARGMKEPWCLATNMTVTDGHDIVGYYSQRFQCEETFRDIKDKRYGYGFRLTHISQAKRRDRFIFLFALAYVVLLLLGVASERLGLDKHIRANTVKRRTHSLFRQGRALLGSVAVAAYRPLLTMMASLLNSFFFDGFYELLS
jgi:hypothetical protein